MSDNMQPIILCGGANGRCLIFGYVESEPVAGEPVDLQDARMILYYPSGGTFGLAADGPPEGSRLSATVTRTVETTWQEWLAVSPEAAAKLGSFDA